MRNPPNRSHLIRPRHERLVRATPRSEPIRALHECLLVHRLQHHQHRSLEHLVLRRRNPNRARLARPRLVQGHPAHRRRPIPTRLEPLKQARQVRPQVRLVLRRRHPVHTRRYASPIHTASMGCASVVMSSFGSRRANSAILRGRVEMTSRPNVPAICPSASSTARPAPSLHRVPSGQVPRLLRDYRTFYEAVRGGMTRVDALTLPPRDGRAFEVPAGHLFRIVNTEGPQVGDLNLWNANDLSERFYSGKTRALHATHVSTGDRLWSTFPHLRPMATITHGHPGLVRLRRGRGRRSRRDRHPLRPLHQPPVDGG